MRAIMRKARSGTGASLVLAMCVMMAVSVLCVSMVSVAFTAPMAAGDEHGRQQAYLAATSAAQLIRERCFPLDSARNVRAGFNFDTVLTLLRQLDEDGGSMELALSFACSDGTAQAAANNALRTNVNLTKGDPASTGVVSVTVNVPGKYNYPLPMTLEVYTETLRYDIEITITDPETGDVTYHTEAQTAITQTFPQGYREADAQAALRLKAEEVRDALVSGRSDATAGVVVNAVYSDVPAALVP